MHEALKAAGASSVLLKIEGGGHGIGGPEVQQRVKAFFDKHLLGKDVTRLGRADFRTADAVVGPACRAGLGVRQSVGVTTSPFRQNGPTALLTTARVGYPGRIGQVLAPGRREDGENMVS